MARKVWNIGVWHLTIINIALLVCFEQVYSQQDSSIVKTIQVREGQGLDGVTPDSKKLVLPLKDA